MKNKFALFPILVLGLFSIGQSLSAYAQQKDTDVLIRVNDYIRLKNGVDRAFVYDVRTKEEFEKTHIKDAVRLEAESSLQQLLQGGNKNALVLLYSIANGRSVQLAKKLRKEGLNNVYALDGGIAAWLGAGLPFYSRGESANVQAFKNSLNTDSLVLVDVASAYCPPCIKVSRIVDSFSVHHPEVKIVKLDMDKDAHLISALKITEAVPTVVVYKQGSEIWKNKRQEDWALLPQTVLKLKDK